MTVTTFVSVKGAPGVTTLACLVGATWPDRRRVVVVEADPSGGDLAARFRLSSARGWSSYVTAARRSEGPVPLDPHLQVLPGGLDVMMGAPGARAVDAEAGAVTVLLEHCTSSDPVSRDLVVDGGRLLPEWASTGTATWLDRSDRVVVVVRRNAPSILHVRDRAQALIDRHGNRVCLVVVGAGRHHNSAVEEFTGLPVIGEVPFEPETAQVASGEGRAGRHLSRSLLVVSARRLAVALAGPEVGDHDGDDRPGDADRFDAGARQTASTPMARATHHLRRLLHAPPLRHRERGTGHRLDGELPEFGAWLEERGENRDAPDESHEGTGPEAARPEAVW